MRKILFFLWIPTFAMAQIETQSYEVIQNIGEVEIRVYPKVMMAKTKDNTQGSSFRKLFDFISGNNTNQQKIAMTSPVHMERAKEKSMAFVLPKRMNSANTPQPLDASLEVIEDPGGYFAALRYSGYTDSKKEKFQTLALTRVLEKEKIKSNGKPKVLVYDSPYKFFRRRNEILIPIRFQTPRK
ncbi:MAG: heme-binding protein [Flavobacteriia bacterium]|nr:heme-binding protein [Flavobacteriia bacterium]